MNRCLSNYCNSETSNNNLDELYSKILSNYARRYSCIPSSNLESYASLDNYYNNLLLIYNSKLYQNSKSLTGNINEVE